MSVFSVLEAQVFRACGALDMHEKEIFERKTVLLVIFEAKTWGLLFVVRILNAD